MLKIALYWPFFPPISNAPAVRGEAFQKYLSKYAKVLVITPSEGFSSEYYSEKGREVIKVPSFQRLGHELMPLFLFLWPILFFRNVRLLAKRRPEILIASIPPLFMCFEAILISKLMNIPLIIEIRDDWRVLAGYKKSKINYFTRYAMVHSCFRYSHKIFVVTDALKHTLPHKWQNKTHVVGNGVDLARFSLGNNKTRSSTVTHLGSPRKYYGTGRLINGIHRYKKEYGEISIEFIGSEKDRYVKWVMNKIRKNGMSKNVVIKEKMQHKDIPKILSKSRIGIGSLAFEEKLRYMLPVKVYEYMASGLPIIYLGPKGTSLERFMRRYNIGFYCSSSTDFIDKLYQLQNDDVLWIKCHSNCLKYSRLFDRKRIVIQAYHKHIKDIGEQ